MLHATGPVTVRSKRKMSLQGSRHIQLLWFFKEHMGPLGD